MFRTSLYLVELHAIAIIGIKTLFIEVNKIKEIKSIRIYESIQLIMSFISLLAHYRKTYLSYELNKASDLFSIETVIFHHLIPPSLSLLSFI